MCSHAKKNKKSKPAFTLIAFCDMVVELVRWLGTSVPEIPRLWFLLCSDGEAVERQKSNSGFCAASAFLSHWLATSMHVELLIRSAVLPMAIFTANILCLYIIWASIHDKIATFYYSKNRSFLLNKLSSFLSSPNTLRASEKDRKTLKNLSPLCSPWKNVGTGFVKTEVDIGKRGLTWVA